MSRKMHHTVADCLSDLGVTPEHFDNCDSLEEEFAVVKKLYFRKMLTDHPDKGGDPAAARKNITAWEVLRELKAKNKLTSLTKHVRDESDEIDDIYQAAESAFNEQDGSGIPCYEHYEEAAAVDVPGYKVEMAKSARSQCVACKKGTGTSLKKQMEMAAKGESVETKKKKSKKAAKGGGGKKGKKKRTATEEDGDEESKQAADDAAAEEAEDSKPPARKRGRKAKNNNSKPADEEEEEEKVQVTAAVTDASSTTAKENDLDDSKKELAAPPAPAAADTTAATTTVTAKAAVKPAPTGRMTRSRAAKSEAIVAIADSAAAAAASSNNKNTKKAPPPAATTAASRSSSNSTTALANASSSSSSKDLAIPPPDPNFIQKDTIRVGSMDEFAGAYGRWHHLPCWRVPYRVWAGLSKPDDAEQTLFELLRLDEVLLTGLTCLTKKDQMAFCAHVMDKTHWAKQNKSSKPPPNFSNVGPVAAAGASVPSAAAAAAAATSTTTLNAEVKGFVPSSSTELANKKQAFVIPRPGVDGAIDGCLQGQRFVLTGTFPEVGGGSSLNLGKDKVKAMIESFGGTVTGSLSGKTNFLVVGKEPGRVKVGDATKRGLPRVDLMALQNRLLGRIESLEDVKPSVIKSFSAGYQPSYNITNG